MRKKVFLWRKRNIALKTQEIGLFKKNDFCICVVNKFRFSKYEVIAHTQQSYRRNPSLCFHASLNECFPSAPILLLSK
jgi:hypothetical protein